MEKTVLKYLADDGVTWLPFTGDIPAPTASIVVKEPITGTGTDFTTSQPYVAGTLQAYANGLAQSGMATETDPLTGQFTLDTDITADDDLSVYYHIANTAVGNSDTVDNFHASAVPQPNTIPVLDGSGLLPLSTRVSSSRPRGVIYLGDVARTSQFTGSTGTIMTLVFTIPIELAGYDVRLSFHTSNAYGSTNGDWFSVLINLNGNSVNLSRYYSQVAAGRDRNMSFFGLARSVAPGSHTATVTVTRSGGTGTMTFEGTTIVPMLLTAEAV